ncbi:MAG: hypothetical protein ACKOZU_07490 [Planctomycetaceae bacterium]
MDADQKRIEEDLRGIVSGEVLCDDASRAIYATDASLFEVRPLAVVWPARLPTWPRPCAGRPTRGSRCTRGVAGRASAEDRSAAES